MYSIQYILCKRKEWKRAGKLTALGVCEHAHNGSRYSAALSVAVRALSGADQCADSAEAAASCKSLAGVRQLACLSGRGTTSSVAPCPFAPQVQRATRTDPCRQNGGDRAGQRRRRSQYSCAAGSGTSTFVLRIEAGSRGGPEKPTGRMKPTSGGRALSAMQRSPRGD